MNENKALTRQELRKLAPSIFAERPYHEVSERYGFIPTIKVIDELKKEGWEPVLATENKVRVLEKRGFARHMLRFRYHNDLLLVPEKDSYVPELVLINSHDRSSLYKLLAGIFKFICSNGLVIADAMFGAFSIRHGKNIVLDILNAQMEIVKNIPQIKERIGEMSSLKLTEKQQLTYATQALKVRYGELPVPIATSEILAPRRTEDNLPDLWHVFNRVQENMMKGGIEGRTARGRRMHTRTIRSINRNVTLNTELWKMTEEAYKYYTHK